MKRHDVITLHEFGENRYSSRIGSFFKTRNSEVYKLLLDYRPAEPQAPILIIIGEDSEGNTDSVFSLDWAIEGNVKSHSIYGYTPFGDKDSQGKQKKRRERIGTIFQTSSHHVYSIKLNLWPISSSTDILCVETSGEEVVKMQFG